MRFVESIGAAVSCGQPTRRHCLIGNAWSPWPWFRADIGRGSAALVIDREQCRCHQPYWPESTDYGEGNSAERYTRNDLGRSDQHEYLSFSAHVSDTLNLLKSARQSDLRGKRWILPRGALTWERAEFGPPRTARRIQKGRCGPIRRTREERDLINSILNQQFNNRKRYRRSHDRRYRVVSSTGFAAVLHRDH